MTVFARKSKKHDDHLLHRDDLLHRVRADPNLRHRLARRPARAPAVRRARPRIAHQRASIRSTAPRRLQHARRLRDRTLIRIFRTRTRHRARRRTKVPVHAANLHFGLPRQARTLRRVPVRLRPLVRTRRRRSRRGKISNRLHRRSRGVKDVRDRENRRRSRHRSRQRGRIDLDVIHLARARGKGDER